MLDVTPVLHALDLALHDPQVNWVDEVIGSIDGDEVRLDAFELGFRVVTPGTFELVQEVVRIGLGKALSHLIQLRTTQPFGLSRSWPTVERHSPTG